MGGRIIYIYVCGGCYRREIIFLASHVEKCIKVTSIQQTARSTLTRQKQPMLLNILKLLLPPTLLLVGPLSRFFKQEYQKKRWDRD